MIEWGTKVLSKYLAFVFVSRTTANEMVTNPGTSGKVEIYGLILTKTMMLVKRINY